MKEGMVSKKRLVLMHRAAQPAFFNPRMVFSCKGGLLIKIYPVVRTSSPGLIHWIESGLSKMFTPVISVLENS